MADAAAHPGLVLGVARFFHDPRGSIRGVLNSQPSEGRLLAYAIVAAGILLAWRIVLISVFSGPHIDRMGAISAQVAAMLFFVPLIYYALAALGTMLARLFKGQGTWRDGRAAFFWAALVSAPVVAVSGLAARLIEGVPFELIIAINQIGGVFFAWALSICFAEAFGFTRTWAVFAVLIALVFGIILLAWGVVSL